MRLGAYALMLGTACGFHPETASDGPSGPAVPNDAAFDSGVDVGVSPDALLVPTGLIAYYPMDTLSGTTVSDATGRGHDGTCNPCPTTTTGKIGGAYSFDGSDVVTIPVPTIANELNTTSAFTAAFWVSFTTLPTDTGSEATEYACPINKPYGTADSDSWQLCYAGTMAQWFYGTQGNSSFNGIYTSGATIATTTWYHFALTWDGSTKALWIDGTSAGSSSFSGIEFDTNALMFGADTLDTAPSAMFTGKLDDVRIYNRALSSTEIATLAAQ
jgi:hypothetical protein